MNTRQNRVIGSTLLVGTLLFTAVVASRAQTQSRSGVATSARPQSAPSTQMDAERQQIWNSPNMLRARAWMQDYFSKSARITPEQAKAYTTELEHLTPTQMRLWLLKFDHDEEQREQQQQLWQQAHSAALSQAVAANQATQRAYAAINRGENEAAGEEQQQLNEQAQAQQEMAEDKQLETGAAPYGPLGYPAYGGIHYHYHLYPYAY